MRKVFKIAGLLFLLAIVLLLGWLVYRVQASIPVLEGEVQHASLKAPVKVVRDDWGVPHITAEHEADAYFALGYCMAQDRLFQMDLFRRLARGELSELLGPMLVPVDKALRTFRLRAKAEEFFANQEKVLPELRVLAEAFCAGINHFQETGPEPFESAILGIEKRPFTPVDSLAVAAILPITFSYGPRQDPMFTILQDKYPDLDIGLLFPGYSKQVSSTIMEDLDEAEQLFNQAPTRLLEDTNTPVIPPAAAHSSDGAYESVWAYLRQVQQIAQALGLHMGSNSWVIAPQRSVSGGAILANDPHIGFTNPSIWYEAHLKYGDFENYGYHLPLIPIALLGHNDNRGWGLTMFANDDVDMFREELSDDGTQVKHKGEWVPVRVEHETINVRFGDPVDYEIKLTPHGPLVTGLLEEFEGYTGAPVSLFWVWQHVPYTDLEGFYKMSHARDYDSFAQAVRLCTSPGVNVSYADSEGNIAWWAAGMLPIRPPHVNSKAILDGASGKDELLGYLPFEQNPQLKNPASGFIATANNKSTVKPLGPIANIEGYWQPDDRAARIEDLILTRDQWTLDELQTMQMDDVAVAAPAIVREVVAAAVAENPQMPILETQALDILKNWDGAHGVDSIGATIYAYFCDRFLREALEDELGEDLLIIYGTLGDAWNFLKYAILEDKSPFWDDITTEAKETRAEIIASAFSGAITKLRDDLGDDTRRWNWGRVHTITFKHPFGYVPGLGIFVNIGPFASGGAAQVVNNMLYPYGSYNFEVIAGPSTRRLIDFSDPAHSYTILPTGNSGHLASPHYDDQAEMFVNGEYREVRFTEEQIAANARETMQLLPQ